MSSRARVTRSRAGGGSPRRSSREAADRAKDPSSGDSVNNDTSDADFFPASNMASSGSLCGINGSTGAEMSSPRGDSPTEGDDTNSRGTAEDGENSSNGPGGNNGASSVDGDLSKPRPRGNPMQYMPAHRVTRSAKAPVAAKNWAAGAAAVPALLTTEERAIDAQFADLDKTQRLVDPACSEAELQQYLRRAMARVVAARSSAPPPAGLPLEQSSWGESSEVEEGLSEDDEGVVEGGKRQRPADQQSRKRSRPREGAGAAGEAQPVCRVENEGLMLVDGALVLIHPSIHQVAVELRHRCGGNSADALNEIGALGRALAVVWTPKEQSTFAAAHARFGDNMENVYREISHELIDKTFKNMIDYFYRCVYAAKEMEAMMPEVVVKPAITRAPSQRLLSVDRGADREDRERERRSSSAEPAPPQREGRMATRGKATVPSWQRSDLYEMRTASPVFSGSDSDEDSVVDTSDIDNRLRALQYIKRARVLLDTFNFSQLMNALLLYDKKQLTIAQLVVRARLTLTVADASILVVSTPGLSLFRDFIKMLPARTQRRLLDSSLPNHTLVPPVVESAMDALRVSAGPAPLADPTVAVRPAPAAPTPAVLTGAPPHGFYPTAPPFPLVPASAAFGGTRSLPVERMMMPPY